MKLGEILENYKGKLVKIGTKDGCAYIYCGECNEETIRILSTMSYRRILEMKHIIERKQYMLNSSRFSRMEKLTAQRVIESTKNNLDNYVSILDRPVFEVYKTIDCPKLYEPMVNVTAIIIEGTEQGKYWTLNEWKEWGVY